MSQLSLKVFLKNFLFVQSRSLVAIILGIIVTALLARALGPSGRGILALSMLFPTLLSTFLNLGVSPANVYHISTGRYSPPVILKNTFNMWLLFSLIGIGAGITIILIWGSVLFPSTPHTYLIASLLFFPISLLNGYIVSILQGQQRFQEYNLATITVPVFQLIFVLLFVWTLGFGVWGAISSNILSEIIALSIITILLGKMWRAVATKTETSDCRRQTLKYGAKSHLSNIMAFVNYRADMFILNLFLAPASVGIYVVAVALAEKLWLVSQGISTVLLPKLGELQKNDEQRKELTPFVARWVLLVTLVGAIGTYFIIPYIILLLYGEAFISAAKPFQILLIGITLGASSRILSNDLAARGKPELNFYVSVFLVSLNICLNVLFIPTFGIAGAALATTTAYSANFFIKIVIYQRVSQSSWSQIIKPNSLDIRLSRSLLQHIST